GEARICGWDAKVNSIGQIRLDRKRYVRSVLDDANGDRDEGVRRRHGQHAVSIRKVDEAEPAFPVSKRRNSEMFLGAKLGDRQTAFGLEADALAPDGVELRIRSTGHRAGSCEGFVKYASQVTTPRKAGNFGRLRRRR